MMRLGYVIVDVLDVTKAVAFYDTAFGVLCRFVHESGYGEMETGATVLAFAAEALGPRRRFALRPFLRFLEHGDAVGVQDLFGA